MHAREPGASILANLIWHFQFVHTVQTLNGTFLYAVDQQHILYRVLVNSHLCMVLPSIILPHNFVYQIKELSSRDATIIDPLALTAPTHIHAEVPSFCNVQYGKARASIIYVFVPPFHFFVICMGRGGYRNHVWKTPCKSLHEWYTSSFSEFTCTIHYIVYNCMMWRQLWVLVQHTIYGLRDHNATNTAVLCCLMACWDWHAGHSGWHWCPLAPGRHAESGIRIIPWQVGVNLLRCRHTCMHGCQPCIWGSKFNIMCTCCWD